MGFFAMIKTPRNGLLSAVRRYQFPPGTQEAASFKGNSKDDEYRYSEPKDIKHPLHIIPRDGPREALLVL